MVLGKRAQGEHTTIRIDKPSLRVCALAHPKRTRLYGEEAQARAGVRFAAGKKRPNRNEDFPVSSLPMIQLDAITLRRGPEVLLEDTGLTVHPGQKIGLVGANGSGKTSLFAALLGGLEVDARRFDARARAGSLLNGLGFAASRGAIPDPAQSGRGTRHPLWGPARGPH